MDGCDDRVRVTLLGTFTVHAGGAAVDLPVSARRLLALLAVEGPTTRSGAAGTLWPEVTEEHALGSLRTTMWRLRQRCGSLVDLAGERVALAPGVQVDLQGFLDLARRLIDADPVGAGGGPGAGPGRRRTDASWDATAAAADLAAVRGLVGDLLPGWDEDWVCFPREHVRQLRLHVLEVLAGRLLQLGRCAPALDAALAAVHLDPLRESAHCAVIAVHLAEGNHGEAVRAYRRFARISRAELGVEPSHRLRALLDRGARVPDLVGA